MKIWQIMTADTGTVTEDAKDASGNLVVTGTVKATAAVMRGIRSLSRKPSVSLALIMAH